MQFRTFRNTDLTVSTVGFGLWTLSTGWWGNYTESESVALMHKALDLGVTASEILEAIEIALPQAGIVAFQAGVEAWREVVDAELLEPTVSVHEGGSGA